MESFFDKFLISSEGSAINDNVNIVWLLKAVPSKVRLTNLDQIRKFNFLTLQSAKIAMETAEQVTSFEFYDKKNNNRVTLVKNLVNQQMSTLVGIEKQLATVKDKLQKNDKFLNEYD